MKPSGVKEKSQGILPFFQPFGLVVCGTEGSQSFLFGIGFAEPNRGGQGGGVQGESWVQFFGCNLTYIRIHCTLAPLYIYTVVFG